MFTAGFFLDFFLVAGVNKSIFDKSEYGKHLLKFCMLSFDRLKIGYLRPLQKKNMFWFATQTV